MRTWYRNQSKLIKIVVWTFAVLGVFVVIGALTGGPHKPPAEGSGGQAAPSSATATQPAVDAATTNEDKANIFVVASKSFCLYSGVDDPYTGNGHVVFSVMLRNSGDKDGSVDVTPVRHYTDGATNESAMDMMSVDVPARSRRQIRSPEFKYKAHEHEIDSCGVRADGGEEINIYGTSVSAITGG